MDLNSDAVRQNLIDAGCDEQMIKQFFDRSEIPDKLRILQIYRKALLDSFHEEAAKLDCLDYLIYQIERGEQNG